MGRERTDESLHEILQYSATQKKMASQNVMNNSQERQTRLFGEGFAVTCTLAHLSQ